MSCTVLLTLLSHWKRRPFQFLTLVLGLALATALWSGVQAINAEARKSYDDAASVLGGETTLSDKTGRVISNETFVFCCPSPERLAGQPGCRRMGFRH
jgi:putative ABC transport system permease protein